MILCSWNMRGLNDPQKIREVGKFINLHNISFMGLLETKIKQHKADVIKAKMHKDWLWEFNCSQSPRGRIWIGWDPVC